MIAAIILLSGIAGSLVNVMAGVPGACNANPQDPIEKYELQLQDFSSYLTSIQAWFYEEESLSNTSKSLLGFCFAVLLYRSIDFYLKKSTILTLTAVSSYYGFICLEIIVIRDYIFQVSNDSCKLELTDGLQCVLYTGMVTLVLLAFVKLQQFLSKFE